MNPFSIPRPASGYRCTHQPSRGRHAAQNTRSAKSIQAQVSHPSEIPTPPRHTANPANFIFLPNEPEPHFRPKHLNPSPTSAYIPTPHKQKAKHFTQNQPTNPPNEPKNRTKGPLAGARLRVERRDAPRDGEHQRERVLGDRGGRNA